MNSIRATIIRIIPKILVPFVRSVWYYIFGIFLFYKGLSKGRQLWKAFLNDEKEIKVKSKSDLEVFFDNRIDGPGIWKWRHYFDIYDLHFKRFRGKPVRILEIGIYSGGSLDMWTTYFGTECIVYGIDIEESCRVYEKDNINVFIGDQSDRNFWKSFKEKVPPVDIIIDDGGHLPLQQLVTLEETLDHLRPGGVYLCEDITGRFNPFHSYISGLSRSLHDNTYFDKEKTNEAGVYPNKLQRLVKSINMYPFVVVIETNEIPITNFIAPKHGTQWQPFF
jgi:hypothetical protein